MHVLEMGELRRHQASMSVNERLAAFSAARAHSRLVRWLKIGIPVVAIGTIAILIGVTFFNPFRKLPAGLSVASYGLDGTRITMDQPRLSGYHKNGQPYQLRAKTAQQDIRTQNIVDLNEMEGTTGGTDGSATHISADSGTYDSEKETMSMRGNVQIHGSSGYNLGMEEAFVDFHQSSLISNQPVTAKLNNGTVLADSLQILDSGKLISFKGHVKSVFKSEAAAVPAPEGTAK